MKRLKPFLILLSIMLISIMGGVFSTSNKSFNEDKEVELSVEKKFMNLLVFDRLGEKSKIKDLVKNPDNILILAKYDIDVKKYSGQYDLCIFISTNHLLKYKDNLSCKIVRADHYFMVRDFIINHLDKKEAVYKIDRFHKLF